MALAFIMVLCLLVYKLAEVRMRQRLAVAGQTVPDQVGKPTARPTMRWLFQCFEGIDLHHTRWPDGTGETEILRLADLHRQFVRVLGPTYERCYLADEEGATGAWNTRFPDSTAPARIHWKRGTQTGGNQHANLAE